MKPILKALNFPLEKFDKKKIYKRGKLIKFKKKRLQGVRLKDEITPSKRGIKYKKEFLSIFKFKLFTKVF